MKNLIFILFLAVGMTVHAQVSINNDGTLPDNSAMLDVKSTAKGLLIPRMTQAQRNAISSPAAVLMIYQTDNSPGFYYNSGTGGSPVWVIVGTGSGWGLTGNSGTSAATNFIGTTDDQPLRFRINNAWAGEIHPTSGNLFLGLGAGQANTGGQANTAIGEHSLFANTNGNFNSTYGNYALSSNTSGYNNTAQGSYALSSNNVGFSNTAVGRNALFANIAGNYNTATGEGALLTNTSGSFNTANGHWALYSNTTGVYNNANGYRALYSNTTGSGNNANGASALFSNTTGSNNTADGAAALWYNSTGNDNTASGAEALYYNSAGNSNTANGRLALYTNTTGNFNTANGESALKSNLTGNCNAANGVQALYSNSTGISNTANGYQALLSNTFGGANTAIGALALYSNTDGIYNTAIGYSALYSISGGYYNTAIGYASGTHPNTPNVYNTVSIGNNGLLNGYQNQVIIGNISTGFIGGVVTWSVVSDARIKNTIAEDVKGLDFISRLRPVTYHISQKAITTIKGNKETPDYPGKYDSERVKYSGFIAQEVEQAAKAANYEFSGYDTPKNEWGLYTIKYAEFVVPLVKAVQEQQIIINKQNKKIDELIERIEKLENK